jgi:SAM-dependent methyltransferase
LQCLVALFAEDIGLLDRYTLGKLLDECRQPADSYDLIGGLFEAMNRREGNPGGRYKGVRYFNGGIFHEPARVELYADEIAQLRQAASSDWSKVSPEIFGTLFEHSMETDARHAFGAHYTSQIDIMKIVRPTIVDPWTKAIDTARSGGALLTLLEQLTRLRVLDPACGSGNFLYIAYREMKRLETRIRERLRTDFPAEQPRLAHVNARQFFGMDINPFAIELAKVTMMLGRKLAIDELHIADEADLPLDNLDANFQCVDALMVQVNVDNTPATPVLRYSEEPDSSPSDPALRSTSEPASEISVQSAPYIRTPWPAADVIIGNPPFLGAKRLKPERGADYVNALRKLYPKVPGMADYCVYWIRRAADHLPACTKADPFAGRAGLVGTQNIRNNQSRVGGLDHVVASGTIVEAVDNQPWSGEANVHVSIANWIKSQDAGVVPKVKKLWSKVPQAAGDRRRVRGLRADKIFELHDENSPVINAALSNETDVTAAQPISVNQGFCYTGQYPRHEGFMLSEPEATRMISAQAGNREVVWPFMVGAEILTLAAPERWVIDFQQRSQIESRAYAAPFKHLTETVLPYITVKAAEERAKTGMETGQDQRWLENWWQHFRPRAELIAKIESRGRFVACSRVTKRPIFSFLSAAIRPGDALSCFTFDDDYSFSVLQSSAHWEWFKAKSSKLKSDYRYTPESVFDTFPWPQSPTKKQIDAVAAAGRTVRRVRAEALSVITGGLRAVYRTLELPGRHPLKDAHADLDAAVLAAYGFSARADLLKQLLDLNHAVAAKEKAGEAVTAPGVPVIYGDPAGLITEDCIRPAGAE